MNFNIYLDDETGHQLISAAEQAGESRNALIRQAVSEWLARHTRAMWPAAVLDFQGLGDDIQVFETGREHLIPPLADPLA